MRQIDQLRRFGLHAEGQLVRCDARFELAGIRSLRRMLLVNPLEQVELGALLRARHSGGAVQIDYRCCAVAEQRALVGGGQKAVAPDTAATYRGSAAIAHHHEPGQVLVFRAQSVGDPGSDGRAAWEHVAGQRVIDGRPWLLLSTFSRG